MTREKAWRIAHKMIKDLQLDKMASAFAGYPIYRSELEYYDYVCDLGSRLEVNFSDDPKSINLWIEADWGYASAEFLDYILYMQKQGDNISYAFSNILSPEKLYILYTSKYIISLLNYISFNSKNIFLKAIDCRHEMVYNKEKTWKEFLLCRM